MQKKHIWDGPIVDAHHHFWEPDVNNHPWLAKDTLIPFRYGDYTALKKRYLPDEYFADARGHNVVETVYVDTEWDPADPLGETVYIHEIAEKYGYPNAVVAQAWLHHDDAPETLARQAQYKLVRSVRHKPGGPQSPDEVGQGQRTLMCSDQWRRGFAALQPNGLHFDLQTPWWNLWEAGELAKDFPETTIILNHAALPSDRSPEGLEGWRKALIGIAHHSNIALKISGIGLKDRPWTLEDNRWIIREAVSIFGTERTMFASNFPVDGLCGSFDTIYSAFKEAVSDYAPEEQERLFCTNARRYYRTQDERT